MKLVRTATTGATARTASRCPTSTGSGFEIVPDDATRILKLQVGEIEGAEFIPYSRVGERRPTPGSPWSSSPRPACIYAR